MIIKLHHFYTPSAYAQARKNDSCSHTHIMNADEDSDYYLKNTSLLVKTVWAVHIDAFYVNVMIRATSIILSNYKHVSGTCAFIAFTGARA